jgi:hypothetical protein
MQRALAQPIRMFRDERGGLGFNALWVCVVLIFLIPFFWDVASVHYARKFAGTGADAAALAAAQEYARAVQRTPSINGIWRGRCELGEYTPTQVVLRYRQLPTFSAPPALGSGQAEAYAARNRARLMAYATWPEFHGRMVEGVPIPWLVVAAQTERDVATAYGPIYQRAFTVPNKALAVAFLYRWAKFPRPCGNGQQTYDFTFEWKITLDTARANPNDAGSAATSVWNWATSIWNWLTQEHEATFVKDFFDWVAKIPGVGPWIAELLGFILDFLIGIDRNGKFSIANVIFAILSTIISVFGVGLLAKGVQFVAKGSKVVGVLSRFEQLLVKIGGDKFAKFVLRLPETIADIMKIKWGTWAR